MLAVKLWKDCAHQPEGMPDFWPAEVRENVDSCEGPWLLMSKEEYLAYKATHQASYETYLETIPAPVIGEE